jgi:hypothetical protein
MNKENAKKIVESALNDRFDNNNFYTFVSNLLKTPDLLEKPIRYENINEQYKNVISDCYLLGHYKDDQKNKFDILKVVLYTESSLDKARTTQRNFIASFLKNSSSNAAIVAFINPQTSDWRFSLVKLEYIVEIENNKLRTKDEITPAKRWSFLVGKNEGCHTAISRFVPILESDFKPNLDEIQNAFNIEEVTDEFYKKYKDLFLRMKDNLDELAANDENIKKDFYSKNIKTEDFAKKTMGQLAFIYFLQKKGWFGVQPKEKWGLGSKTFLRDLFNNRQKYGENYFNDVLEWFFYEALSQDRGNDSVYKKFDCRIPFLNGGLFEPMNSYSWETTDIVLSDDLFSNKKKTAEGDIGDGILDVFDRYNFTVNESEPLEKEVAVDPEMLGKVFENLLGVSDRKSKGAFYTPREIVHQMCQESLIQFLYSELNHLVTIDDLRLFVCSGVLKNLNQHYKVIDDLLKNVRVCDPAVGSGAFPLGMLNEIVKARQTLNQELKNNVSKYQLKLDAISNSLYGVDLDSGAIEIAKLRMWLSLAVDEDEPKPLPNLDHKMMQGNSLISKLHGIEIFDNDFLENLKLSSNHEINLLTELNNIRSEYLEKIRKNQIQPKVKNDYDKKITLLEKNLANLSKDLDRKENLNLFEDKNTEIANSKILELKNKVKKYLSVTNRSEKENLKIDIDTIKWDLIELSLSNEIDSEYLTLIKSLRLKNEKPFFVWKLEFNEVFVEKDGFDIVIGNPPYVQIQKFSGKPIQKNLEDEGYTTFSKTSDLYCMFYERGVNLLKPKGFLNFITSNKWLRASYGEKSRRFLSSFNPVLLVDLGPNIFKTASVSTNILLLQNARNLNQLKALSLTDAWQFKTSLSELIFSRAVDLSNLSNEPWIIENDEIISLKNKITENSDNLINWDTKINKGILTSLNQAFIVNEDTKRTLIEKDKNNQHLIKPLLRGKDIEKYSYNFNNLYLLATGYDLNIPEDYPFIYEHLKKYEEKGKKRDAQGKNWWNLRSCSFYEDLENQKIIYSRVVNGPQFCLDNEGFYIIDSAFYIRTNRNKYILAILNSKLITFYYKKFLAGGILGESGYEYRKEFIEKLPIAKISKNNIDTVEEIEKIVDQIYSKSSSDIRQLDSKLNELIYNIYNISKSEINLIESDFVD